MKNKLNTRRFFIYFIIVIVASIFSYFLYEASNFAKGIKNDVIRRDSILNEKGIRLDSMGSVKYEDYKKVKDSLDDKE